MVNSTATMKKITQKAEWKKSFWKLKCYLRKYSFNAKENSERGKKEDIRYRKQKVKLWEL